VGREIKTPAYPDALDLPEDPALHRRAFLFLTKSGAQFMDFFKLCDISVSAKSNDNVVTQFHQKSKGVTMVKFIICIAIALFSNSAAAQWKKQVYEATDEEAVTLLNQLLSAINPSNPENARMPAFLKEKITWVYDKHAAGVLDLMLVRGFLNNNRATMMRTFYTKEGKATIEVSAPRLLIWVRMQGKTATGFTRMQRNSFAVAIAHEAVHLELPKGTFAASQTKADSVKEEMRTWEKIDRLIVAEILAQGEELEIDFVNVHSMLKRCKNPMKCAEFRSFIEPKSPS
jgi:hypothetical protein